MSPDKAPDLEFENARKKWNSTDENWGMYDVQEFFFNAGKASIKASDIFPSDDDFSNWATRGMMCPSSSEQWIVFKWIKYFVTQKLDELKKLNPSAKFREKEEI